MERKGEFPDKETKDVVNCHYSILVVIYDKTNGWIVALQNKVNTWKQPIDASSLLNLFKKFFNQLNFLLPPLPLNFKFLINLLFAMCILLTLMACLNFVVFWIVIHWYLCNPLLIYLLLLSLFFFIARNLIDFQLLVSRVLVFFCFINYNVVSV